jgi:Lhr-like helicase
MQTSSSVFDSLAKPVRKALTELGFQEPTLPQTLAFPEILAGTNRQITVIQAILAKNYRYHVENPQPTETDYEMAGNLETSPEALRTRGFSWTSSVSFRGNF